MSMDIEAMKASDPEVAARLQRLQEKLGLVPATPENEAAEAAAEPPVPLEDVASVAPRELTGKDVDWSDFDLDPNLAHLYPVAKFIPMLEGPKWVALLEVIEFESAPYKVSKAEQKQGKESLGDLTTKRVNGGERWRIATVFASGPGFGVVMFTRTVQIVLPDPRQLRSEAELPAVQTDAELQSVEDTALGWIEGQGQKQDEQADILTDLVNLTPAEIAAARPHADERLFKDGADYTREQAAANAEAIEAPSPEQVAGAGLNPPTERVPLGWGPNATDGQGSVLPTTVQVPAVQALEAGQAAAEAMMGPDFENEEGTAILDAATPLVQIELPLEGEQK